MSLPAPLAVHLPVGVPARLDPDNAQARRWLAEELARPAYREHNDPISRLVQAIKRAVDALLTVDPSTSTVLPPLIAGAITAVVVAGLLLSLRYVRREARARTAPAAVLGSERLTAAQFRSAAGWRWRRDGMPRPWSTRCAPSRSRRPSGPCSRRRRR